jgi:hypothetical protein
LLDGELLYSNNRKLSAFKGREMVDAAIKSGWIERRFSRNVLFALAIGMVTWQQWGMGGMNLKSILAGSMQSATTRNVTHNAAPIINMTTHNTTTNVAAARATTETITVSNATKATNRKIPAPSNETSSVVTASDSPTSPPRQEPSGPVTRNVNGIRSLYKYTACCGLGHRLARQAAAYDASHRLGFQLQVDWGQCDDRDIFSSLFREETATELAAYVHSLNQSFQVNNEVPGTYTASRNCAPDEVETNYKFYKELRRRFLGLGKVDSFVQLHFQNKFSLGLHIRDGNGEVGDFVRKKRLIQVTPVEWTQRVAKKIVNIVENAKNHTRDLPPPVLFIASDNARYIGLFQTQLEEEGIPVVHWDQEYTAEGTGVFMGQRRKGGYDTEQCLKTWMDMLMDMVLLGSTDVLIVGQYSSFSQTMPMHLALGKHHEQRMVEQTFCEVLKEGTDMDCHKDYMEWCRNTKYKKVVKSWIPGRQNNNVTGWTEFLAAMPNHRNYRNFSHRRG